MNKEDIHYIDFPESRVNLYQLNFCMLDQKMNAMDLSKASGVPYMTVTDILHGRVKDPRLSTVCKLATALGVGVSALIYQFEDGDLRNFTDQPLHAERLSNGEFVVGYKLANKSMFVNREDLYNASSYMIEGSKGRYIEVRTCSVLEVFPILADGYYDKPPSLSIASGSATSLEGSVV